MDGLSALQCRCQCVLAEDPSISWSPCFSVLNVLNVWSFLPKILSLKSEKMILVHQYRSGICFSCVHNWGKKNLLPLNVWSFLLWECRWKMQLLSSKSIFSHWSFVLFFSQRNFLFPNSVFSCTIKIIFIQLILKFEF